MTKTLTTLIAFQLIAGLACAADCFVAPDGADTNPGTKQQPFATLRQAVEHLRPGDTCYLREGRYHQHTQLDRLRGTAAQPITIAACPGEKVVLDGTVPISAEWTVYRGSIYKATLREPVWQLFVDDRMMMPARWPNARIDDGSLWDMPATWRHQHPESTFGQMIDDDTPSNTDRLADTRIDFTDAIAIMNIGSWLSWAQRIERHQAGSDRFTYDRDMRRSGHSMARAAENFLGNEEWWNKKKHEGHYYLEGKLACLDAPGEWFYDPTQAMLYLWLPDGPAPGGPAPGGQNIRGKTQTYAVEMNRCSHVTFRNLTFFATTLKSLGGDHLTLEDCRFEFPSFSRRMLGDLRRPEVTAIVGPSDQPTENVIRNCVFENSDGPILEIQGHGDLIENCYFHDIDTSCLGTGGEGTINAGSARHLTFRRNTVHTAGNSEGFRAGYGTLIELNNLYRMGLMQHDGSAINVGISQQEGTVVRYNWTHDTNRNGIRFDAVGSSTRYGTRGVIHHNVNWNSDKLCVKGDDHRVANNLSFDCRKYDLAVLDKPEMGGINRKTVTRNNLAGRLGGRWWGNKETPLPGIHSNNFVGDVRTQLRDADNWDFRPRQGSELIDAGLPTEDVEAAFLGRAPDIGPYEFGDENYWIPGRKFPRASTPVPPDGTTTAKTTADLMWLGAYRAAAHDVYFGHDRNAVAEADRGTHEYQGNRTTNIFQPKNLQQKTAYYWRVDAVTDSGAIRGDVWTFTTR